MKASVVLDTLFFPGMNAADEGGVCYIIGLRRDPNEALQYSCQLGNVAGGCGQIASTAVLPTQVVAVDDTNRLLIPFSSHHNCTYSSLPRKRPLYI